MRFLFCHILWFALAQFSFAAAEADILVAYDNSYSDTVGGDENAEVLTANSVAASNWINDQSGTPARMRICGYHKTTGQGGRSTLGGYVGWMAWYGDGNLDDVTTAADAAGADLVAFICAPVAGETSAAVAYQPGRYAAYGTGSFWNNVVAHESGGHNYGCDHRDGRENPKTIMLHNYCGGGSQAFFSNPNIRLNGTRLLGEGSCLGGTAGAGGDNAYLISTTAQGVADRNERVVYGSNLYPIVRRWQFNKPAGAAPAGTTVASDVGGALATVRGQGAVFTGTGIRLPGGTTGNSAANSVAAYLDLPNGIFSSMPDFTIEVWATPLSAKNWMRVIEIGRTTQTGDGLGVAGEYTGTPGSPAPGATDASDVLGLSTCTWTNSLNDQRFLAGVDGAHVVADSNLATTAGEMHHYAITFTDTAAGATVKWFRDGIFIRKLDVTFDSAALEDVNVWLGRSQWSGDEMAHMDIHDIRILGAAIADGEVAGNFRIGPHDSKVTLWANDGYTNSGFTSGAWEFGQATPGAGFDYEIGTMMLRSPFNGNSSFPGRSLTITGGNLHLNGNAPKTTTINDLRLNGGTVGSFAEGGAVQTLAGNLTAVDGTLNHIRGGWGPLTVSSAIRGATAPGSWAGMLYTENAVTLTGVNTSYRGATIIGDGRFSTLKINSETNLGGNPNFYGGAWLELNRGVLETTATMTIDDVNRCIRIGPSGGFLRPAPGTTLTVANPITSPAAGNTLQTVPMDSNPIVGILFKDGAGTLVLTSPNNSHNAEMQILDGILRIDGAGRINNGDHWMPVTLNSTFHWNSTANQILRGAMSGNGALIKNNSGTLEINGSNPFTGSVTINAGTLYANPGNAASNRSFSFASGISVNPGGTLKAGANGLFGWDGTQTRPVTIDAGATMTTDAANTDVNVGTITLNGGTLAGFSSPAWGSWNFKRVSGARLLVTENSSVSAPNVGLGTSNSIDVSSGKTLAFSGAITDLANEGVCALVKSNGTGTLSLTGTNTYTGATSINTGTVIVNGSLGTTAVTIASAATLGGTGSIAGATTIHGTHSPGNSAGSQTFGNTLTYGATSRLKWELTSNSISAGTFDKVTAAGAVTITNGAMIDIVLNASGSGVALNNGFWTQSRSWTFLTSSAITGTIAIGNISTDPAARSVSNFGTFSLQQNTTSATLVFTPYTPSENWRLANFGTVSNAGNAADTSDPDKDGLNNLLEYALGSNPNSSAAASAPLVSTAPGRLRISFTRNTAAADLTLTVIAADSLTGPWTDTARSTNGTAFTSIAPGTLVNETGAGAIRNVESTDIFLTTDPAHPRRFMRLRIDR